MTITATPTSQILNAKLRDRVETPDGPMYVKTGGWSKETGDRVEAALAANPGRYREGVTNADYRTLAGPYERVLLVSDPAARVHAQDWCTCPGSDNADAWVRYEKYTAAGRVGHGWACPGCGGITQTG